MVVVLWHLDAGEPYGAATGAPGEMSNHRNSSSLGGEMLLTGASDSSITWDQHWRRLWESQVQRLQTCIAVMFPGVLLLSFSLWVQFLSRPLPGTELLCCREWEETGKMLPVLLYAVILRFEVCRIFSASLLYSRAFLSYFPWFPIFMYFCCFCGEDKHCFCVCVFRSDVLKQVRWRVKISVGTS